MAPTVEPSKEVLRRLAAECVGRPLIHDLVVRDLERWDRLPPRERSAAFDRAVRRVSAVCPWMKDAESERSDV